MTAKSKPKGPDGAMRLLIIADTHLGSSFKTITNRNPELGEQLQRASRDAFASTIDLAISEQVNALVLAGDVFDDGDTAPTIRTFLVNQLAKAAAAGIPSVLIQGNHDALLEDSLNGDLGPMVHILDKETPSVEIGGAIFHGQPFDKTQSAQSILTAYPAPVPGLKNIGLMHNSLKSDPNVPGWADKLLVHGYDLWCLGHRHAPSEEASSSSLAIIPGILQPRHFGERWGGSVVIAKLDDDGPVFHRHKVGKLDFAEIRVNLTGCTTEREVARELRASLNSARDPSTQVAVRLFAITDQYAKALLNDLTKAVLEGIDRVYLDKIEAVAPRGQENSKASVPFD